MIQTTLDPFFGSYKNLNFRGFRLYMQFVNATMDCTIHKTEDSIENLCNIMDLMNISSLIMF